MPVYTILVGISKWHCTTAEDRGTQPKSYSWPHTTQIYHLHPARHMPREGYRGCISLLLNVLYCLHSIKGSWCDWSFVSNAFCCSTFSVPQLDFVWALMQIKHFIKVLSWTGAAQDSEHYCVSVRGRCTEHRGTQSLQTYLLSSLLSTLRSPCLVMGLSLFWVSICQGHLLRSQDEF